MSTRLLALALVAAAPPALAMQPEGAPWIGIEPHRVFVDHPREQARLASSPAFRAFVARHPGWRARFDEATGAPRALWGAPIPVPTDSARSVADAVRDELDRHADLLRFEPGTLVLAHAAHDPDGDTWYVDFDAPRDGVPVWRGGLTARVKRGHLVLIGALAYGDRPTEGGWTLTAPDAIRAAIRQGPAPDVPHHDPTAERMWLPVQGPAGIRLVATWMVRTRTTAVPGHWVSFVRADSGELLSVHNEVRFFDGQVTGWHAERTVDGSPLVRSPIPHAYVSDGDQVVATDDAGTFALPDTTWATAFDGPHVTVENTNGPNGELVGMGPDLEWTAADATQAEISTWVFLHQVRAWAARVAPDHELVTGHIQSNVNLTDASCNAFFDGQVNFYAAADGCANTAEIADVNYHEWGHGFHLWSVQSGWQGFDGSLSEGAADTVAFLQTGDSRIAPYFFNNGGAIRDVAPDRVYPDDYDDSPYAVHSNGLIFGGAMWDLWHLLMDEEGVEEGTRSTERIFAGLLKGGPGVAQAYDEAILADDDDGDLSNGTPHECAIIDAFGRHGLGPLGRGEAYVITWDPPPIHADPAAPFPIALGLSSAAPNCYDIAPTAATAHYRVDGGDWQTAALDIDGDAAIGQIPALPDGSFVEYWLEVQDASGALTRLPAAADIAPYTYRVGPVLEVWCTDFERGRAGFRHELVAGEDNEGADDWQRGTPAGKGGDPSAAYSGDHAWGNDLGWEDFNGKYQNDKENRLFSEVLDTRHHQGVFLSYRRWLNVEDGVWDRAAISADGERVWANVRGVPDVGGRDHLDREWIPHVVDLRGLADDGAVQLEWSLRSDAGVNFGGWTLDDVCLLAPDTPDNRLGVNDIAADRRDGAVDLAWLNPLHGPVARVVVVRTLDGPPAGPDDGEVVGTLRDVALGEPDALTDADAPRWDAWYAVYPSDGTHTLSWTREGYNLVFVPGDGPAPARVLNGGCGCVTGAPTGGLPALLAALGLALARRRR